MCGRYALYGPRSLSRAEADYFSSLEQFPGSWNVAPGQTLPITIVYTSAYTLFGSAVTHDLSPTLPVLQLSP